MLTVNDIYEKSKSWIFEKRSSTVYNNYIIDVINKVLAELYDENNMMRMFKCMNGDETKLPFIDGVMAHQVTSLNDEVDYEDEYVLDVIPRGIDSYFLLDDDLSKMQVLQTEYNNARVMRQTVVPNAVIDELMEKARDR